MRSSLGAAVSSGILVVLKSLALLQHQQMTLTALKAPVFITVLVSVNYVEKEVLEWVQEIVQRLENWDHPLWEKVHKTKPKSMENKMDLAG